jgi:predicted TIM-barrel fold metal-dependent hydrolase
MSETLFFDSLVHTNYEGAWLAHDKFDASLGRLLKEIEQVRPYRACLVNIAGYSDNAELADIAAKHPDLFVPIAGFNPSTHTADEGIERELAEIADRGFAGIKLHPRLNDYDPLDKRCLKAISHAGRCNLVVLIDTLFRQKTRIVDHPANIIDRIAFSCPDTRIVLLHGGASAMLDIYEIVRARSNLLLDTSFTLMRYAGSSLDDDIRFVFRTLDQRMTVGSDFPEYSLRDVRTYLESFLDLLPKEKSENILFRNLDRFFADWSERRL